MTFRRDHSGYTPSTTTRHLPTLITNAMTVKTTPGARPLRAAKLLPHTWRIVVRSYWRVMNSNDFVIQF